MKLLTTAKLNWFDDGCCDVKYLDIWEKVPVSYQPGQSVDESWHVDEYSLSFGSDTDGRLFRKASDLLMRYQFYPEDVLSPTSDFSLWDRWAEAGDRIVQRIHLFSLFGKPVADIITMNEVHNVITEPRRHGFTLVTVGNHIEQGEWSVYVEWHDNDELTLILKAISKPVPAEPSRNHGYMRARQKAAHQRGLQHFKQVVLA